MLHALHKIVRVGIISIQTILAAYSPLERRLTLIILKELKNNKRNKKNTTGSASL